METLLFLRTCLVALLLGTAMGCSEDASDGAAAPSVTYEAFDGNAFAGEGMVTGFLGLVIDGIPYLTEGATIQDDDGQDLALADLEIGMKVHVQGKLAVSEDGNSANGFLNQITIINQVRGLIEWSDGSRKVLKVNGQDVLFDENTVFSGFATDSLQSMLLPGVQLSISGTYVTNDTLLASRISQNNASDGHARWEGGITNATASSMEIRGITLSFTATELDGYVVADNNHANVTVKNFDPALKTAELVSIKAVDFTQRTLNVDDSFVISGAIKNLNTSTNTLDIRQLPIQYAADTPIAFGDVTDIAENKVVSIQGQIKDNGSKYLEASHIRIHQPYAHWIKGNIANIETIDNGLVKNITIESQKYQLTRQALIQNLKDGHDRDVFNTLAPGDMVSVGYIDSNGTHLITKLQRTRMTAGVANNVIAHAPLNEITFNASDFKYNCEKFHFDTTHSIEMNRSIFLDKLGRSQTSADFKTYAETSGNANREAIFTYDKSATPFKLLSIHVQPLSGETVSFYMIKAADKMPSGGVPPSEYNLEFTKETSIKKITIASSSGNFSGATKQSFQIMSSDQSGDDSTMKLEDIANDADLFTAIHDVSTRNEVYVMLLLTWPNPTSFQIEGIYVFDKKEYINKFRIFQAFF
ncbi:MAG: hypothetical protein ISP86_05050 [Shewanellaceae bacterium]|nr:hypothetical protein [Shewanellaceae bacterium]